MLFIPHFFLGHRVGEVAHDYVPALKQWLTGKGIKNSYDSWHGSYLIQFSLLPLEGLFLFLFIRLHYLVKSYVFHCSS